MLEEKVVIVTGGTRGIGFETVKTFLENKAIVVLFGSRKETVDKALEELNGLGLEADGYCPDLQNIEEIDKVIKEIIDKYGKIDVLINNLWDFSK